LVIYTKMVDSVKYRFLCGVAISTELCTQFKQLKI
jgi:hypothetical protein